MFKKSVAPTVQVARWINTARHRETTGRNNEHTQLKFVDDFRLTQEARMDRISGDHTKPGVVRAFNFHIVVQRCTAATWIPQVRTSRDDRYDLSSASCADLQQPLLPDGQSTTYDRGTVEATSVRETGRVEPRLTSVVVQERSGRFYCCV